MDKLTPIKAIREKCMDCMGGMYNEIRACPVTKCGLWKFRLGINPNYKRKSVNPLLSKDLFAGKENWGANRILKYIKENGNKN